MSLLDYPGKIAATVFTGGCNFRCPFCHNASLVFDTSMPPAISEEDFFAFLAKRSGMLDGVCITGGEPLFQKDIAPFILRIKSLGFLVKLDTNGSFPTQLKALVNSGLVDYVAMDIKNSPSNYAKTIDSTKNFLPEIEESVAFLLADNCDYEFRTTVVQEYHTLEDIIAIGEWIIGAKHYYLQNFEDSGDLIQSGLHSISNENLVKFAQALNSFVPSVEIRNK